MYFKFRRLYISKSKDPPNVAATTKYSTKSRGWQVRVGAPLDLESYPAKIAALPKLAMANYDLANL